MSLGSRGNFFFLSGDQSKSFHFVSITASSSHTSADSTKWINSEHWCDSKSSLLTFRWALLGETKLPLSHKSYFSTSKLNKTRTWAVLACLSILWDCWPIPDAAVGQECCQRVAEQDLSLRAVWGSRVSCTGASQDMTVTIQTRQCSECGMSYSLMCIEDI